MNIEKANLFIEAWIDAGDENETLNLDGLTSAVGLQLPENLEAISLNGLTSAEGLTLPNNLSDLSMDALTSAMTSSG